VDGPTLASSGSLFRDRDRYGTVTILNGRRTLRRSEGKNTVMTIPTVFLVGVDRLALVPEYLNLGSVVVIAPDRETLRGWAREQEGDRPPDGADDEDGAGTVVDLAGRRILVDGATLPLSDLEFRVLSELLSPPGRALSFRELRRCGWGDGTAVTADRYTVRALVQRLRAKLEVAGTEIQIRAVRGFGFRADVARPHLRLLENPSRRA
jgi:DNA-binding response OmpR family regulator